MILLPSGIESKAFGRSMPTLMPLTFFKVFGVDGVGGVLMYL